MMPRLAGFACLLYGIALGIAICAVMNDIPPLGATFVLTAVLSTTGVCLFVVAAALDARSK